MSERKLIIAGGSGFLGQALVAQFAKANWEVVVFTRRPSDRKAAAREVVWDGETLGPWADELEGATAVVNLCGRSVDCRYTAENRRIIVDSRVKPTRVIGEAIAQCQSRPVTWLNASSATIYRHTLGEPWDESCTDFSATAEARDAFSIEVIRAWERELDMANTPQTRKVALRTTMVLGHGRNSVFPVLCLLARFGLGGRMGSGQQFVSWLHEEDFCRAVEWIIAHESLNGPVNLAAPNPVTNAEMMRLFRVLAGMSFGLPATKWMLEIGAFILRTETELILKSRRVVPGKLSGSGFRFHFPQMRDALENLVSRTHEC